MTKEEQRIALAKWCGWNTTKQVLGGVYVYHDPSGNISAALPNYLNDLNAMHEAALNLGPDRGSLYAMELRQIVVREQTPSMQGLVALRSAESDHYLSDLYFYEATAAQRAEALLRTIGKWEEKK